LPQVLPSFQLARSKYSSIKQGHANDHSCTPVTSYITVTVTDTPDVVTVAAIDPSSISVKFSTMASIDTIEVIQKSQAAPVGFPYPLPQYYTNTADAPLVEVTEVDTNTDGIPDYYKPNRPAGSTPVSTTTVTVLPTPPPAVGQAQAPPALGLVQVNTTINTTSFYTATTTRYGGWNASVPHATTSVGGYGPPRPPMIPSGASHSSSSSDDLSVTTTVVTVYRSTHTLSGTTKTTAPGYGNFTIAHISKALVARQTCTEVDAGRYGTWCNNWDGSTVVSFSTYETTGMLT
jgi:hypothetical protein